MKHSASHYDKHAPNVQHTPPGDPVFRQPRDVLNSKQHNSQEIDPEERHNRWGDLAYAGIKSDPLLKFVQAEIARESTHMARVAHA